MNKEMKKNNNENQERMPVFRKSRRSTRALPRIWKYLDEMDCWLTAEEIMNWYNREFSWGCTMNQLGNWLGKNPHAFIRSDREYRIGGRSDASTCKAVRYWRAVNETEYEEPLWEEGYQEFRSVP